MIGRFYQVMGIEWIRQRLSGSGAPLILDGGMGTELEKNGVRMDKLCWSGMAVLDSPDLVKQVHSSFIRAGAEVITTNTYSTGRHMLDAAGAGDQVTTINSNAVKLAREAISEVALKPVGLAGSICEWSSTANIEGSRWNKLENISMALQEQGNLLADSGVDIIMIEEAQSYDLSIMAIDAAVSVGLPVWLGLSCKRDALTNTLVTFNENKSCFDSVAKKIIEYASSINKIELVNIMHTDVSDVFDAIDIVKKYWAGPLGVYPESGFFKMPNWQFVDVIKPHELIKYSRSWLQRHPLRLLGGCCGLGPSHIEALKSEYL